MHLCVVDLDDGDLDVLVGQPQGFKLSWYPCLLASPTWPFVGTGLAGASGTPLLTGGGALSPGGQVSLSLTRALPGSTAALVSGLSQLGVPLKGGVLVPNPDVVIVGLPLDAQGQLLLDAAWPAGIPADVPLWFQVWVADPSGPAGFTASNGLGGTTGDCAGSWGQRAERRPDEWCAALLSGSPPPAPSMCTVRV